MSGSFSFLAGCVQPTAILPLIGAALSLPDDANGGILDQIAKAIAQDGDALLVLDNFEQLVADGREVIASLLSRAGAITCLVTSRRALALPGEREIPVAPLPIPAETSSDQAAAQSPSVRLFLNRAEAVRPGFRLTAENRADVIAICRQLEGLPLAIELAASRVRVLGVEQIRERLVERFALLVDRFAAKDERHRSLKATLEWSDQLLSAADRRFFARLGVFQGGFTLEAATEIATEDSDSSEALDRLEQLRVDSLLSVVETETGLRFRMLETVREFALERLTPQERERLRERHARYFQALAERADLMLVGEDSCRTARMLDGERENLNAALEWARHADPAMELEIVVALRTYYMVTSRLSEGTAALERGIETNRQRGVEAFVLGKALLALGLLRCYQEDFRAAEAPLQEAHALLEQVGDVGHAAIAYGFMAWPLVYWERYGEAMERLEFGRGVFRALGLFWSEGAALNLMGYVARCQGDLVTARKYMQNSVEAFARLGEVPSSGYGPLGLARIDWLEGEYDAARSGYAEALRISPGRRSFAARALRWRGWADWQSLPASTFVARTCWPPRNRFERTSDCRRMLPTTKPPKPPCRRFAASSPKHCCATRGRAAAACCWTRPANTLSSKPGSRTTQFACAALSRPVQHNHRGRNLVVAFEVDGYAMLNGADVLAAALHGERADGVVDDRQLHIGVACARLRPNDPHVAFGLAGPG